MKRYDYYLHRSRGKIGDYFGNIGLPFKVNFFTYYFMKIGGWRATKVPKGSPIKVVLTQALINDETNLESYAAEELFKEFCTEA